jgi:excisionase family DNA binding protein
VTYRDAIGSAMESRQDPDPPPRLSFGRLTHPIPEVAELLGVGRTTVYGLIDAGELGTIKIGKRRLVPHTDLVDYIERLRSNREVA